MGKAPSRSTQLLIGSIQPIHQETVRRNSISSVEKSRAQEAEAIETKKAKRAQAERERKLAILNRKQMKQHEKEQEDQVSLFK